MSQPDVGIRFMLFALELGLNGRSSRRTLVSLVALLALALTGCTNGAPGSIGSSPAGAATSAPAAAGSGGVELPVQHDGEPREIAPGTYVTSKPDGFFPGLKLTIPAGWSVTEADTGELALHSSARPDSAILLWKDMVAVVTNDRSGTVGQPAKGVGSTAAALVTWLTSTSDFAIVARPKTVTVGNGVKGTQLTLTTAASANFAWNDCPANPHCAAILTDPKHWGSNYYVVGGSGTSRIFVTTLHYRGGDHTFFVTLDSSSASGLATLAREAQPVIDSIRLPRTYFAN